MHKILLCCVALLGWMTGQAQTADFTADRTTGCAGLLTVNFTSTSTGNITGYSWNFGDGGTSTLQNPAHTYTNPGSYNVTLSVSGPGGTNTKSIPNYITVFAIPQASFSISEDTICEGTPVTLSSQSTAGSGPITLCLWTFNDGSPADTACPSVTHTFTNGSASIRTFYPNLLVVDQNGCNSVSNETLFVTPRPAAIFGFSITAPCTAPSTVIFNNTSTVTNIFNWDFGIQGSITDTSTQRSPQFTYSTPGTYTVTLTAGPAGCNSSTTQSIQLENPVASFVASDTVICKNTSVQFFSNGSNGTFDWNFGDPNSSNNTANGDSVIHTFDTPGNYTVTLNLSAGGCSDSFSRNIRVLQLPFVWLAVDDRTSCNPPHTVQFFDSTRAASSWSWNFGDPSSGVNNTSALENPVHTFNAFGNYTVTLTVTDTNGCTNTATYQDYIVVAPVVVDFERQDSGCLGKNFTFLAQVSSPGDPIISSYIWDFGDGSDPDTVNVSSTNYTYPDTGIFDVTLTVITSTGCTVTLTRPGFIRVGIRPNADFIAQPLSICFKDTVSFLDQSLTPPNITAWQWDFGDGGGSQSQNPVHIYDRDTSGTADPFDVTLVVYNNGCADTLIRNDYVVVLGPKPNFVPVYDCNNPLTVRFDNLSDSLGMLYLWNFGDGDTSSLRDAIHTYASRGDYTVTLLDSNINTGCAADADLTIMVRVLDAVATATPTSGCYPITVQVTGSGSLDYTFIRWDFGDSPSGILNNSNYPDTLHLYNRPGNYGITMTATDVHGCTQTETIPITANGPQAGFILSPQTGCPPLDVFFVDTTRTFGSSIVSWSWNFGNGQSVTGTYPTYTATYQTAGNFLPYLTVTDANGCISQFVPNFYVNPTQPTPVIALNPNDTNACRNEPVSFSVSPGPSAAQPVTYSWTLGDGATSTSESFNHSYLNNGTYPVTVIATDNNGCKDTTTTEILVYTTPATVTITPYDSCVELNGVRQAQVFVNMTSDSNLYATSYQWDLELTTISQNLSSIFYTYSVPPDTYYVRMILTNQFGCRDTFFNPAAVVIPGPQGSFSFSPDSGCRPLTVDFIGSGSNIDLYTWDFGDGNVIAGTTQDTLTHTYLNDDVYTPRFYVGFELNTGATCYVPTDPAGNVTVTSLLGMDIQPETLYVEDGGSGQVGVQVFDNNNLGPYDYQWTPSSLVNPSTLYPDSFSLSSADGGGIFTCTIPYGSGCSASDSVLVLIIPCETDLSIPNIFTPNGDGKNDEYFIEDLCNATGFKFRIYNRWGRIVYESTDTGFRWNGTDEKGNPVSDGTYYYVMETAKVDRHGWIQIIRD